MKQFLFLFSLAIIFSSCCNQGSNAKKNTVNTTAKKIANAAAKGPPFLETLNGVDSLTAAKYIQNFKIDEDDDDSPRRTSIWFSKEELTDIYNLLDAEITEEKKNQNPSAPDLQKGITDGIRIYFSKDNNYNLGIIVVSTKDGGPSPLPRTVCPSGRQHKDYDLHNPDSSLFKFVQIGGLVSHDDCNGGAVLYQDVPCPECAKQYCNQTAPHYLTYQQCLDMVSNYGDDSINSDSEWFDFYFLKSIVDYGRTDRAFQGIRIYFARHLQTDTKSGYPDQSAFVITTTVYDPTISNFKDNFDCKAEEEYFEYFYLKNKDEYLSPSSRPRGLPGQDNGELCQPNCQ